MAAKKGKRKPKVSQTDTLRGCKKKPLAVFEAWMDVDDDKLYAIPPLERLALHRASITAFGGKPIRVRVTVEGI